MNIFTQLASKTDILFRQPVSRQEATILEVDGKFEVIRPLGLPVRVKRGFLWQKRFSSREQAEKVMAAWEKEIGSRRWREMDDGSFD